MSSVFYRNHNRLKTNEYNSELKNIAKNAGFSALGILFMNVMAFVNNALITRVLGADSYGLFVLATNIFAFIVIIPQFGFENTIVRYVAYYRGKGEEAKVKGVIVFGFKLLLVLSLIVMAISFLMSPLISERIFERHELAPLLKIILLSLPFVVIAGFFYSALNGLKLIKYLVIGTNILNPLIFFLLIIIVFYAGYRLLGLIWAMAAMGLVGVMLSYYFLNKGYFKHKKNLQPIVDKKELLDFAFPVYLNKLLNNAIRFAPIFIMGYFLTNKDIGVYNVGFRVAMLVSVSLGAFRQIFSPTISTLFAKNNIKLINQLYKTITKWIFTISLFPFCIIILFAEPILNIFGNEFTTGVNVLLILVFSELISAAVGLIGNIIIMSGRPKVTLFNAVINFLMILVLCFFLIPEYGIIGTAISYAITVIFINIISLFELYYFEKIQPFKLSYLKPLIAAAIVFVIIFYAKTQININFYIEMILGAVVFLTLFILILWVFKFDIEDKYIFRLITDKFKRKE